MYRTHLLVASNFCEFELNSCFCIRTSISLQNWEKYTDIAKFAGHLPHRYGNSQYGITQYYLPPGRGDIPAFTPAEAGTRLSDPGGMQG